MAAAAETRGVLYLLGSHTGMTGALAMAGLRTHVSSESDHALRSSHHPNHRDSEESCRPVCQFLQ